MNVREIIGKPTRSTAVKIKERDRMRICDMCISANNVSMADSLAQSLLNKRHQISAELLYQREQILPILGTMGKMRQMQIPIIHLAPTI